MIAGSPQPETGVQRVVPELFSTDLDSVALETDVHTSFGSGESQNVEYKVGPAGGPYALVASVPRKDAEDQVEGSVATYSGWVAASDDFSKLILQVGDPNLVPPHTNTKLGSEDLYEYSKGQLKQVNVGVGNCGATIVKGQELHGVRSSSHAVSADGSRVFFEAVPGNNCSSQVKSNLFVRVNGSETIDIGNYRFAGANPAGTVALLEANGNGVEYLIYEAQSGTVTKIFPGSGMALNSDVHAVVSQELKNVYFHLGNNELYRYDVATKALGYLFNDQGEVGRTSPDGLFYYFQGSVAGVPGEDQVFLYDGSQNMVECVSCASSTDPEPKLGAFFPYEAAGVLGPLQQQDGHPNQVFLSDNGEYAFFDTPARLVSADVDEEIAPERRPNTEYQSEELSLSSDVYEWRRDGVDGCGQLQGCVALITNGRGGYLNVLIGATPSGNDVFIYTRSELVQQDNDNSGDVYDVRVDGGFRPPPPRPVECEAAECSNPLGLPNDATPASSTFSGPGNVVIAPIAKAKAKKIKTKSKKRSTKKRKGRAKKKGRARGAAKAKRSGGGRGR